MEFIANITARQLQYIGSKTLVPVYYYAVIVDCTPKVLKYYDLAKLRGGDRKGFLRRAADWWHTAPGGSPCLSWCQARHLPLPLHCDMTAYEYALMTLPLVSVAAIAGPCYTMLAHIPMGMKRVRLKPDGRRWPARVISRYSELSRQRALAQIKSLCV